MNSSLRAFLCAALLLAGSTTTHAQSWVLPAKTPDTPVPCGAGCSVIDPPPLTAGYQAPIATFTGRFLDSTGTSEWFMPFRTARANFVLVMPALDRIYFRYGDGTVAAYKLSRFFTRLESGEQLVFPITPRPANRLNTPELFLNWDDWFNPELSTWKVFNIDGATRMPGFDVDDKGYVYVASTIFGWGVVKDSLGTGGKMQSMFQKFPSVSADAKPNKIAAIKGATRYYAYNSSPTQSLWDVTDRSNPVEVQAHVPVLVNFAKNSTADRVAVLDNSAKVSVYSADGLATGGAPMFSDSGYLHVTSDGTNFYGLKNTDSGMAIAVIVPSGPTSYTLQGAYSIGAPMQTTSLHYGDGYLVLTGGDAGGAWDLRLFKVGTNLIPKQVFINATPGNTAYPSYFRNYYGLAMPGFVTPGYINMNDGTVYRAPSGKVYLIICAKGLGDVYELAGGDSVTASNDGRVGTTNGNAPATSNLKTFYGDPVQFTAHSASANVSTLVWNFGNPENTSGTNTQLITGKDQPIVYQYSNLAKTALGSKTVVATSVSDANIHGAATVNLESPVARFAIAGASTKYLFTQPNASSSAPIVVGDSFVDASDGTVESHYASWTLDSAITKALPSAPQSVGLCGAHAVSFGAFYAPYDGTTLLTRGTSNIPVTIDGPVNYSVRPFAAAVEQVTFDATSITFHSASRFTADASIMTAAQISGFSYKWEIVNAAGVPIVVGTPVTGSLTVPNFVVQKSSLTGQGNRVRLTLSTSAPFQALCAGMETSVALSNPLSVPDPKITPPQPTECQGTPCTFTATSISGIDTVADNWTYKWLLVNAPAGTIDSNTVTTTSTFTPLFLKTGVFTVQVTATNAVGAIAVTKIFTVNVAANPCGTMNASSFVPTWLGLSSNCSPFSSCTAGETIHFTCYAPLVQNGYDQNCATHTYTWTFPDSTTGTTNDPVIDRVVSSGGTVKVNVNNGTTNFTYTASQPLSFGSTSPPPSGCDTMSQYNMYLGVTAASCPSGGTCSTGDSITFEAQPYLYNINCAQHNFRWDFGDGSPLAYTQKAYHTYTTNGAHSVTMTVSNPTQTYTKTVVVTTTPGSGNGGGSCPTMTTSNVAISFSAPSGCSSNNTSTPCKNGETVSFDVTSYTNYDFSCSNQFTFNWNFGDGSAAVTGKSPTHTFGTSGNHVVVVTISNPTQQNFQRTLMMLTSDSTGSGLCGVITPNLTLSITYANPAGTCNQLGGDCAAGEVLNFSVLPYQYDLGCAIHTFDWDFGDGSAHVTTKDAPHQYVAQGNYNVKCKVSNGGAPVTLTQQVSVKAGPPASTPVLVTYSVAPLQGVANGFLFTPSFDHPELVAKWQWDYGDGQKSSMITGTPRPISWIYADNKPYTVTLTAYDSSGQPVGTATHPGEPKRRSVRH